MNNLNYEILNLIKPYDIKSNLNPIVYYGIKVVSNKKFRKRSLFFSEAVKWLFESLGNTLNVSLFKESKIMSNNNFIDVDDSMNLDFNRTSILKNQNAPNQDLSITFNKDKQACVNDLFENINNNNANNTNNANNQNNLYSELIRSLFTYSTDYILDRDDDYILLFLIKSYIFTDEDPKTSKLMLSYNLYSSSVELIFCLKLVEQFPKVLINPGEEEYYFEYINTIKYKVRLFFLSWKKVYAKKYGENQFIKDLIGEIKDNSTNNELCLINFLMNEPLLPIKNLSLTKLIKEGIFCFEIEEVARQLCIIDQEFLNSLHISNLNNYFKKANSTGGAIFENLNKREKQLKCYILLFILMQNCLENKKVMTENFIILANICKSMHNYQTSYTIISTFNMVNLTDKELLWKQIEKKYREIYNSLVKEYNNLEFYDIFDEVNKKNTVYPCVPNLVNITSQMEKFMTKINNVDTPKFLISREYKDFNIVIEELIRNKYPYFQVNPLFDFLKIGFIEIFKTKKWNLKIKQDFSNYIDDTKNLNRLLEILVNNFKKVG